ncbi:Carboxymethylenebutenolidase [Methylorubrum populi BJ001]|jgi:carboxymethylenebutenolidase|uniref:Carboxymethylenebutenolidase n=1 Tax=Methylorubrum populi (strain ATCC BAA-705 / NCIMB 13946 / BJ001) TaxID=441620 RepID=B1ZHB9_METPB|nr:dienelactone hydrolase family protein [Methylorubrum populi]ACB79919.1 Carboxymethylenebutenolidase [Methylorubrum populi BJ001]OAH33166.1 carboxymethylenebutenolidase [Methylorubrum populi]PZP72036.1 MAG: dienelactone hydrolase family protein [Methylorubrum populi]
MTAFDADLRSLAAQTTLSRRTVIATSLATGFAMAVQPVAAQSTITTDTNGLTAGEVKIPTQDGEIPAYRAMPAEGGPFPTILVIQEIFGVHEHIKDVCRRLAKLGYFALAPELYARQGDVSRLANIQQIVSEVVSKVPDAQVMSDLDAAVAFAKATGKADTMRLGITGFCWGGRITWLYAAHNPGVKAGVAWYGRLVGDASDLMPKNPVDVAADLKAPVLGLYGGADQGIPVATIDRMKEVCRAAGKTCDFVVYPEAPHAFHADYRPSYRAEPAQDGWKRLQDWFRQHGVA